jgi:flagellar hook-basal body complex protein FliE
MTLPLLPAGVAPPIDVKQIGGEPTVQPRPLGGNAEVPGIPFADLLKDAVAQANAAQQVAEVKMHAFAAGTLDDIHGTMIAVKQADIELKLVANVRNKLVDAFNDLWRMNI